MRIHLEIDAKKWSADLSQPLDISIPIQAGLANPNCFYAPLVVFSPVIAGDFIGSTAKGGPVNFLTIQLNPHGTGTHTECVGHIADSSYTINQSLGEFHFVAKLVSLYPMRQENGDRMIERSQMEAVLAAGTGVEALIIRTLPNGDWKRGHSYSGTNPPYIHEAAMSYIVECGIQHLLVDIPSVDREEDGGDLLAHRAFWVYPDNVRKNCTITELIYVDDKIKDGIFLLNLQIASFEIDVSPSKPILYQLVVS